MLEENAEGRLSTDDTAAYLTHFSQRVVCSSSSSCAECFSGGAQRRSTWEAVFVLSQVLAGWSAQRPMITVRQPNWKYLSHLHHLIFSYHTLPFSLFICVHLLYSAFCLSLLLLLCFLLFYFFLFFLLKLKALKRPKEVVGDIQAPTSLAKLLRTYLFSDFFCSNHHPIAFFVLLFQFPRPCASSRHLAILK